MKKISIILLSALILVSCDTYNNSNKTQRGAAIGIAGGALLGAILGNNMGEGGNSEVGAVLGAAIGGAAGSIIGNQMDKQAKKIEEEIPGAEVKRVDEGIIVTFDENSGVYFDTNKSEVNAPSQEILNRLVGVLNEYSQTNVVIVGHTDSTGSNKYNMTLSEKRAKSVTNFFISKGLQQQRFTTQWFGEEKPEYDNATPEGRAKNRRVNVVIVPNEQMKAEAEAQAKQ
ncbi:OmpA family protein [Capnocytophaga canimorsus]|uniref:OmpA family protein n=1 Tax=Capnocytophaga canimorsus TaxID=28188 RepID=UPI001561B241|nr:OmpA family protein [Capnocytophaga canimorsus]